MIEDLNLWILRGEAVVPAPSIEAFVEWAQDPDHKRIALTFIPLPGTDERVKVSTVFLPWEDRGSWFETKVFGGGAQRGDPQSGGLWEEGETEQYSDYGSALEGHFRMVDRLVEAADDARAAVEKFERNLRK